MEQWPPSQEQSSAPEAEKPQNISNGSRCGCWVVSTVIALSTLTTVLVLFIASLIPSAWRLIVGAPVYGLASSSMIRDRKFRCLSKLARIHMETSGLRDDLVGIFAENATTHVAQTGLYEGPSDIQEYLDFVDEEVNPMFASGVQDNRYISLDVVGYAEGICTFRVVRIDHFQLAPPFLAPKQSGSKTPGLLVGTELVAQLDYKSNKIIGLEAYLPPSYLEWSIASIAHSRDAAIYDFICEDVLAQSCNASTVDCRERLQRLPLTDGPYGGLDGNSQGCRALHAVFAQSNPDDHCAHVAFDPTMDAKGRIKCQESKEISPRSQISEEDWDFYAFQMETFGIDPDLGTRETLE